MKFFMFKTKGQINVERFTNHIRNLVSNFQTDTKDQENQKAFIENTLYETSQLIKHNEWGIGLENLLDNLYEIDFKIDDKSIEYAYEALKSCGISVDDWKCLEELKRHTTPC